MDMRNRNKAGIIFIVIALFCLILLAVSIKNHYYQSQNKDKQAMAIKERLLLLKDIQEAYFSKYHAYASRWEQLIAFIEEENFYITDINEKIISNPPYPDSVVIQIDTLNIIPVKDSLLNADLKALEIKIVPGSKFEFSLEARNLANYSLFEIKDTISNTPKINQKGKGRVPYKVGSMERPTTQPNWK